MTGQGNETIVGLRKEIDVIDERIVKLLAERQRVVERILTLKKQQKIPARVPERVDHVLDHVRALAVNYRLDPALAETMWTEMIEWFIAFEDRQLGK
jgi:isochorismate pyruvate lyase